MPAKCNTYVMISELSQGMVPAKAGAIPPAEMDLANESRGWERTPNCGRSGQ